MSHNFYPKFYVVQNCMSYKYIMSFKLIYVVQHIMSFKKLYRLTMYVA